MDSWYRHFNEDFMKLCQDNADKKMIIFDIGDDSNCFFYNDVLVFCRRFITFFRENGLKSGDTVVTIMPNSPEAIICFFSCILAGINYAPLSDTITNREYNNWLSLVNPKMIIKKSDVANYETTILTYSCACDGNLSWLPLEKADIGKYETPYIYLMTSGTTGIPKAMAINADKLWSSGKAFVSTYNIQKSELRFWNYLPMSYLGGLYNLALIPLCCAGSFVITEPFSGKTILNYWNYVNKHTITALWLVPSIIQGLLRMSRLVGNNIQVSDKIRIAFLGTAPIQLAMKQDFETIFGIRLYENFALSESTFLTAESNKDICYREQGSVGMLLPYVQIKLKPVDGIVGTNCIWIKTPFLFEGYLTKEGRIELELDQEGFFDSKDMGMFNNKGVLVLQGRSRDIIKKGGLFVSLAEIENIINNLQEVDEAVAIPIEHDFYGEAYVLCIVFQKKEQLDEQMKRLHLWMKENMVAYKLPERILAYDILPRTASGKIKKKEIAEELREVK